jgi:RNA recognition motif-containing protein
MTKKLYVGNLSFKADETALRALFEDGGFSVVRASIATDRQTGRSRGFGFVEFSDPDQAQAARESIDGKAFLGRNVRLDMARERDRGPPRRFGPGGGGSGSDRGGRDLGGTGDRPRRFSDRDRPGQTSERGRTDAGRDSGPSHDGPPDLAARIEAFRPQPVEGEGGGRGGRRRNRKKGEARPDTEIDDGLSRRKEGRRSRRERNRSRMDDWD